MLDLFAGRPSLEKLSLWSDEGTFEDPITIANGRKQYEAQWVSVSCSLFSKATLQVLMKGPVRSAIRLLRH